MYRELLAIARDLAERETGRPKKESLARAVSTAYYAFFHGLAEFCARELIGAWTPWQPFRHVYRSLDHSHTRKVFETSPSSREPSDEAKRVGETFLLLQKQDHSADYDPGYRTLRRETHDLIDRAEEALELLNRLSSEEKQLLASRLIGRTR